MPSPNKYDRNDARRKPAMEYLIRSRNSTAGPQYYVFVRAKFLMFAYWRRIGVWPTMAQARNLCLQHARQFGHKAVYNHE